MNTEWKFYKGALENGFSPDLNDTGWETVKLGHTWNNIDGQDGTAGGKNINETDYFRGDGWYRKRFSFQNNGKLHFLRFHGANTRAEVFVNGKKAGEHVGGYTAFNVDITPFIAFDKENLVAVRVNNERDEAVAPITADFTFYGGIYREIELIEKAPVHFAFGGYSARGLKISTPAVSREKAVCVFEAEAENSSDSERTLDITAVLKSASEFDPNPLIEQTDFDVSRLTAGTQRYEKKMSAALAPHSKQKISFTFEVAEPHLWNGREDPFLYDASIEMADGGETFDVLREKIGFRFFSVDAEKGFFLNGKSYPLRGVSRHQDREGLGNALTKKEHDEDFSIIYDMGVNALRLAHYPQSEYFYGLCDRYGIVVWAEIPFVDEVGGSGTFDAPDEKRAAFFDTTKNQLCEMINQNYNHPAIVCWGLQNEVKACHDEVMKPFMNELYALGKNEDPSRLLTQATNQTTAFGWKSDLIAWNIYPGWYGMNRKQLGFFIDKNRCDRPVGISEYGAGGSFDQHSAHPKRPKHDGKFHPQEYQALCHEAFLRSIDKRQYLWGTFVWNMFDFGSDGRNEGSRAGVNDKGLVSFDRKVKKDSYYFYMSSWSKRPTVKIAGADCTDRKAFDTVKVYSNCTSVTLWVNGKKVSEKKQTSCRQKGVFLFRVLLKKGENAVTAEGVRDGKTVSDAARLSRK